MSRIDDPFAEDEIIDEPSEGGYGALEKEDDVARVTARGIVSSCKGGRFDGRRQ
jgi:hypothetical protein